MASVTIRNGVVLATISALSQITSTSALVMVKKARLRLALEREAAPIIEAFDAIGAQFAAKNEDGTPTVQTGEGGRPLLFVSTRTPCYVLADAAGFQAAVATLDAAEITLDVPLLTVDDLALLSVSEDVGEALLPFVDGL